MTTEYQDSYGITYRPIDELNLEPRNDFTIGELLEAIHSDDQISVDYYYPYKPGTDSEGYSLTEKHSNGSKKYLGYDYDNPKGFRLTEVEFSSYEKNTLQGFGHFVCLTSGNLGDGHDAWALYQHVESGRLFLNTGWYSSWDSGEMNDWTEVEEAEVKVVRYRDINNPGHIFDNPAVTV